MNIGIVTTWFERGAAYVSRQYADVLSKGNNIFIFARDGEQYALKDERWIKYNVHWATRFEQQVAMYFDMDEFAKWIELNEIDCVLFNEQRWWRPILFCNQKGIKCGAYIDYYTEETIPFFAHYDFIICNTGRHYDVFKNFKQSFYIPWGTDINLFKPQSYNMVENDKVTFFHSAGYNPNRKGTNYLIKVFDRLSKEYKGKCKLVIHTQVNIEDRHLGVENILKTNDYIEIIQNTIPAPGLYYLGDVYVYPSILDGIGLTLAEAFSCGLPAIVTNEKPMTEFGNDEIRKKIKVNSFHARSDGYYWPEAVINEDSLYDAMKFFIEHKQQIPEFKKKARNYALEKLDWTNNSMSISTIFKNTVQFEHDMTDVRKIVEYDDKITPFITRFDQYITNIERIKNIINKYKNKQIFLYPYGEQTKRILKYIDFENIDLLGVIDKKNFVESELPIFNTGILKKYCDATIIVTSFWYKSEIIADIKEIKQFHGDTVLAFESVDQLL